MVNNTAAKGTVMLSHNLHSMQTDEDQIYPPTPPPVRYLCPVSHVGYIKSKVKRSMKISKAT